MAFYYKEYGLTEIKDDRYFAILGSIGSIMNGLSRLFWGAMMDKVIHFLSIVLIQDTYLHLQRHFYTCLLQHLLCRPVPRIVCGSCTDDLLLLRWQFRYLPHANHENAWCQSRRKVLLDHLLRVRHRSHSSVLDPFRLCQCSGQRRVQVLLHILWSVDNCRIGYFFLSGL